MIISVAYAIYVNLVYNRRCLVLPHYCQISAYSIYRSINFINYTIYSKYHSMSYKWKSSVKFGCLFFPTCDKFLFSLTYSRIIRKAMFHVKGHEICFALCALTRNAREYSVHAFLIIVYKLVLGILLFLRCVCIDKTNYKP